MTALAWISGIAATIVVAFFLGYVSKGIKGALAIGLGTAIVWLAWTLGLSVLFVGYTLSGGLQSFQLWLILVVAVVASALATKYHWAHAKQLELEQANRALEKSLSELTCDIEGLRLSVPKPSRVVRGPSAHRNELLAQVAASKNRLIILSGWVREFGLDSRLRHELEEATKRGVRVFVGWGYQTANDKNQSSDPGEVWLRAKASTSPYHWRIAYFRNHSKAVIRDNEIAIIGSFNWLSNSGGSPNDDLSIVVSDPQFVASLVETIIAAYFN